MTEAVREARGDELDAVLGCYEWLFLPPGSRPSLWDPERAGRALAAAIAAEDSAILVAEREGRLAGLCTAYLELNSVRFGPRCWVEDLVVDPEHRSEEIGKVLLDAAKNWGRERGATHLELDSGEARKDAHRFYEREGPSWRSFQYSWEL
ncbi:MAG: GNAT family N-acetyltransferase [Solirubrobacterales bacterium]|nr:GNAT family N-acetyltransferase [Solirubrobacterales bacterium]